MELIFEKDSIIVLSGPPASGKSSFAKKYFKEEQILNSDFFRKLLGGVFNIKGNIIPNQNVSHLAFSLMEEILENRAKHGYLTVIDATNLDWEYVKIWKKIADKYKRNFYILFFDVDEEKIRNWNKKRKERVEEEILNKFLEKQKNFLKHERIKELFEKGKVIKINPEKEYKIKITPHAGDVKIIEKDRVLVVGDLHGDLEALNKVIEIKKEKEAFIIFLGDVIDRGEKSVEVLLKIKELCDKNEALLILGNHEENLLKALKKEAEKLSFSTSYTYSKILDLEKEKIEEIKEFLKNLPRAVILNNKFFISHALVDIDPYKDLTYQYSSLSLTRDFPYKNEEEISNNTNFILVHGHINAKETQLINGIYNLTDLHNKKNLYFCLYIEK